MPERTSYANGVPSWVDLASADVDTSIAFYSGLFGWEHAAAGLPEETGGYGMFMLGGKVVAGIGPLQDPAAAARLEHVPRRRRRRRHRRHGDRGRRAGRDARDRRHGGRPDGRSSSTPTARSSASGRPAPPPARSSSTSPARSAGTSCSAAARTRRSPSTSASSATSPRTCPARCEYTVLKVDGNVVAGIVEMDEQWPEGVPPHWHVYFVVADADAAARAGLGARRHRRRRAVRRARHRQDEPSSATPTAPTSRSSQLANAPD